MNSAPGRSVPSSAPASSSSRSACSGSVSWNSSTRMTRNRSRNSRQIVLVVAHEIARLDQQIEKIERAGLLLALFVAAQALAHLLVQQRGKIGVGAGRETRASPASSCGVRGQRLVARHADRERGAGPFLRIAQNRDRRPAPTSAASQPSHTPSGTMSPTMRRCRSMSALVVPRLRPATPPSCRRA